MQQRNQLIVGSLIAIVAGIAVAWAAAQWVNSTNPTTTPLVQFSQSILPEGGDFTVSSVQGDIRLSDFKGKVVLLYFGYTSCPDVCPTSMGTIKGALSLLTPAQLSQVQGLFISVDPERDKLEQINNYAQYFHANIRGASSQPENLEKIARQYGAFFRKVPMPESALGYMMDHTSTIYVLDKEGKVQKMIQHVAPPAELAEAIKSLL